MSCKCYECTIKEVRANPSTEVFDYRLMRYFLCPICGNKRCPHGANHENECTNSNEIGQKGSLYE